MTALVLSWPSPLWYLARASGILLLVLLTANVVLGVLANDGWAPRRWPRFVVGGLHRNLALLAVALLAVHVLTAELDPFAPIGWLAVVVPFVSRYRPLWLGLGTLGADILAAVVVTSLLRRHLRHRTWKAVHWLAYVSWPVAFLHALGTGTDTRLPWVFGFDVACLVCVVVAAAARLRRERPGWSPARLLSGAAVTIVPVSLIAWAAVGPLRPGWARRSGTPATLLSPTRSATAARAGAGQPAQGGPPAAFRAPFGGTISQSSGSQSSGSQASGDGGSAATVEVAGSVEGGSGGSLRVVLSGTPAQGGGVVLSSGRGSWRTAAGELYSGPVTSLQGGRVGMTLAGPGGSVTLTLVVSAGAGRQVGGIVIVARAPSAGSSS